MDDDSKKILLSGAAELGVKLDTATVEKFESYLDLLRLWGKKMNLTSRLKERDVIVYHFLDSLAGYRFLAESSGRKVLDIGTGAGFPGLPLALCIPSLELSLLESSRKKISFCREVILRLGLKGVKTIWGRGEETGGDPEHKACYDWVLSRAMAPAHKALKISRPFLKAGGKLLLYKGFVSEDELAALERETAGENIVFTIQPVQIPHLPARRSMIMVRT